MLTCGGIGVQVVYKRYASLYFVAGIEEGDNELITLEVIHHFVEVLDRYFGNVCELDLIFNFHKVGIQLRGPTSGGHGTNHWLNMSTVTSFDAHNT